MAEQIFKELKTKIALKTLTYSQWDAIKDTYKPLRGEVCVCEIPTGATVPTANSVTPPTVLFKVGDGVNVWSALNWASALAADVYTWAKKPEAEFIAWVNEQIEHPVLSIVDPDAATKKFITKVEVSDHQVTITRSDVDWSDVKNAPDFALKSELPTELGVMSVKVTDDDVVIATPESATSGDVTIDVKHKEYNPATSDAVVEELVPGADNGFTFVEPAVDKYGHVTGLTTHTVNYKIPEVHDGTLTLKAADGMVVETKTFTANDADNVEFTVKHAAAATPAIVAGSGRTYVTAVHADDYGHVTGWETATETIVDTNTAHTHAVGAGLILGDVKGGIDGEVLTSLNIEFVDATNTDGKLKLVDKTSKEVLASFETANFVKDSFLESAVYDPTTHKITLGFIDNTDNKQDIEIDLTDLVNLYDADGETLVTMTDAPNGIDRFTFKIKDGGVNTTQLADSAVTSEKLAPAVNEDIVKGTTAHGWGDHSHAGYLKVLAIAGDEKNVTTYTAEDKDVVVALKENLQVKSIECPDDSDYGRISFNGSETHTTSITSRFGTYITGGERDVVIEGYGDVSLTNTETSSTLSIGSAINITTPDVNGIYVNDKIVATVDQLVDTWRPVEVNSNALPENATLNLIDSNDITVSTTGNVKTQEVEFNLSEVVHGSLTKADTALQEIEAGVGLKVSEKKDNKQTIDIDEEVIFILNANF